MINIVDPIAKAMGTWSSQITIGSMFLRLFLSITLAAILGCERASKRHSAGVRTFLVISLASTIASMIDMFLIECFDFKYAFVSAACVIALVSISNNSIIFSSKSQIKGFTTSASLWACGIIGLAIGMGFYTIALIGFVILLCSLSLLPNAERFLKNRSNHFEIHLELNSKNDLPKFTATIRELGLRIDEIELNSAYINSGISVYSVCLTVISPELKKYKTHTEIISAIQSLDYVNYIEEM